MNKITRMWMINPKKLCRQHLLGEHKELHQLIGSLKKGKSVKGHIEKGQIEIHNITSRHKELVGEMISRGYNHQSPLKKFKSFKAGNINILKNERELEKRCKNCKKLIKQNL
ncbi:MAG: pyrimidine dimer DNA glycosylase/endonuclease V [archaeon]|nr:pyrimidine dimer DNA glycosylase/endonuclease V [archaeon]